MKPFEIALFKHFIGDKGMTTVWINLYRKNHLKENPTSIEEFLSKVEPKDVMMKAFRFYVNSDFGFDYWSKMTIMWLEFLDTNKDNYTADEWYKLTGMSKILRMNWDAAKHWREETKLTAAIRLGIDLSLIGLQDKVPTAPKTQLSEEYLREKTRLEMEDEDFASNHKIPEPEPEKKEDDGIERLNIETYIKGKPEDKTGLFGEFEFLDLHARATSRRRLGDDELSVNTKGDKARITFNQKISNEIKKRGGYEYAALLKNKKGEVALILNDMKGVTLQDGCKRENSNVMISSKVLVGKVVTFLDITKEYEIIKATEIEKTNDYVAYILTKINK